ncbi:unnamed protein product, partial [Staurois parvus]
NVSASYGANIERPVRYFHRRRAEYRAGRSALQRDLMERTADLWGGGERVSELDRYPLLLLCSLILPVPLSSGALSSRLL